MGVAPAALPRSRVTGHGALGNVAAVLAVPPLETPFPASGLSPGVDAQQCSGQAEQLLASNGFRVQCQLGLYIEPGMEAAALDNGIWPDGLDCPQHTLLAVTDDVVGCRDKRQQLSPVCRAFVRHPVPSDDKLRGSGNEADTATNPDTVNSDSVVHFTCQGGTG